MRNPFGATRRDLDASTAQVLAAISRAQDTSSAQHADTREQRRLRRRIAVGTSTLALLASLLASFMLFGAATTQLASPRDPGRISIAIVDEADRERPFDVSVSYDLSGQSSRFMISVSDWTSDIRRPVQVAIYVCGALRDGLRLSEVNSKVDLDLRNVPGKPVEFDSFLMRHDDCSYAVATGNVAQVILAGESAYELRSEAAERAAFTMPGVSTIMVKEQLGDVEALPISRESSINVSLTTPGDFAVGSARPQVPSSGQLSWTWPLSDGNPPADYLVSGALQDRAFVSQLQLFVAGALAGVAGAALMWLAQLAIDSPRIRRREFAKPLPPE